MSGYEACKRLSVFRLTARGAAACRLTNAGCKGLRRAGCIFFCSDSAHDCHSVSTKRTMGPKQLDQPCAMEMVAACAAVTGPDRRRPWELGKPWSLQGQVMRVRIASQWRAPAKAPMHEAITPDSPNWSLDVRGSRWLAVSLPASPGFPTRTPAWG